MSSIQTDQRTYWKQLAPMWKKWSRMLLDPRSALHRSMFEMTNLEKSARILDFATGAGEPSLTIASMEPNLDIIGCDISAEMLDVAAWRAKQLCVSNYSLVRLSGGALPFETESFDAAFCCFGLEFVDTRSEVLLEIRRVLKEGAPFIVATWGDINKNPFQTVVTEPLAEIMKLKRAPDIFKFSDPSYLVKDLEHTGFRNVQVSEHNGEFFWNSFEELWQMKQEVSPPLVATLKTMSSEQVKELETKIFAKCAAFANKSNAIRLPYHAWVFACLK